MSDPSKRRRRAAAFLVLCALAGIAAGVLLATSNDPELVPGGGTSGEGTDPLAFERDRSVDYERRAAAGLSHVLYAKSPGGAAATAERTARWRPQVDAAAAAADVDPALIEAMVFVESAGRPEVIAGDDPEAASGLTQILAETGQNLLGMEVDLAASRRLTRRIARAERRGRSRAAGRLRAQRRRIDERFDPKEALAATGRYLTIARERFGRDDLAVASYHMGIGNLQSVLSAFDEGRVPYVRVFFESTPLLHPEAHRILAGFGDDSSTYYWRVLAGREIMRLYREEPAELARLEALHAQKNSAEEVLHPRTSTEVFAEPDDLRAAREDERLVDLPDDPDRFGFAIDRQMGELARRVGEKRALYRALRPEALALLIYLADGVREVSGDDAPLIVTSTVRDTRYQRVLGARNYEATRDYSLHTTGFAFDVLREYKSPEQALAFQFWLDRLQALNLIAWVREPRAIHVTVSSDAERLEELVADVD